MIGESRPAGPTPGFRGLIYLLAKLHTLKANHDLLRPTRTQQTTHQSGIGRSTFLKRFRTGDKDDTGVFFLKIIYIP